MSYHITDDGDVRPCQAHVRSCIYSQRGEERHFDNEEDARKNADNILKKSHPAIPVAPARRPRGAMSPRSAVRGTRDRSRLTYQFAKSSPLVPAFVPKVVGI